VDGANSISEPKSVYALFQTSLTLYNVHVAKKWDLIATLCSDFFCCCIQYVCFIEVNIVFPSKNQLCCQKMY
jgi:hypothetical protein